MRNYTQIAGNILLGAPILTPMTDYLWLWRIHIFGTVTANSNSTRRLVPHLTE